MSIRKHFQARWNEAGAAGKRKMAGLLAAWGLFALSYTLAVTSNPSLVGAAIALGIWLMQGVALVKVYDYEHARMLKRKEWESKNGTFKERLRLMRMIRRQEMAVSDEMTWPQMIEDLRSKN